MKVPTLFIPERNLETTVQAYLKDRILHKDPNLTYIISVLGMTKFRHRTISENFVKAYKSLDTSKGCLCAGDFFEAIEQIAFESNTQDDPTLEALRETKKIYDLKVKADLFQAFLGDPLIVKRGVIDYVMMIIGLNAESRQGNSWGYMDPQTKQRKTMTLDLGYIRSVEEEIGLKNQSQKESFRMTVMKIYGMNIPNNPGYDFMDNLELVKAVTDIKLKSGITEAGSLTGALVSRTNEENQQLYDRMIKTMLNEQGYCKICADKAIEYFCTPR